ncbi:MAG: NADH-quinone oxidoreductase subunit J [Firmicutes bacterium]|nr:NADH-quinone oxidoreductase subunit J [Bacillota bacterium]
MTFEATAFYILAVILIWAALKVVTSGNVTHAVFALGLAFVAVAGLFLLAGADFLAAAQVLIYVGAVTTMIVFAIMLSNIGEMDGDDARSTAWRRLGEGLLSPRLGPAPVITAAAFAVFLYTVYSQASWTLAGRAERLAPTTASIGEELFTTFVVPFEIASVVLLVALVGAIVLTQKEERS